MTHQVNKSVVRLPHFYPGICFAHVYITAGLLGTALFYTAFDFQAANFIYPCCLLFTALACWSFWSWKQEHRTLIDPYAIFLLAAILFNGGQALLEVLHLNSNGLLNSRFSTSTTLKTLFLLLIGLASLHLGALLSCSFLTRSSATTSDRNGILQQYRAVRLTGWVAVAISVVPSLIVYAKAFTAVMSYGYFVGLFQQDSSTGLGATPNILATFLVPGALLLLAGSHRQFIYVAMSSLVVWLYAFINLFLGSRAPAVASIAAYLWIWHRTVRPLSKVTLVLVSGAMLLLLPTIAAVRNVSGGYRSSLTPLVRAFEQIDNPVAASVSEMGNSMGTVAYTIDLVPTVRDFGLGESYFYALLTIFPNLFWTIHPAVQHGLLANWLVRTVDPSIAALNGGLGFSFLAEAYLNFGWYGTVLILAPLGFLLGAMSVRTRNTQQPATVALVGSILFFVLILARGESASVIRGITWYSLLPFAFIRCISRTQSHS